MAQAQTGRGMWRWACKRVTRMEGGLRREWGHSLTSSGIAGSRAKRSFTVCGWTSIRETLPWSRAFSLATLGGSEAREEGSARITVCQVRGAEGDRNQETKSVCEDEVRKMTITWLAEDKMGDEGYAKVVGSTDETVRRG